MRVDANLVDLRTITAPFLNVVAQKDDLVALASSIALNNVVGSKDKSIIEFPSGHVGLIMSKHAHKEVWPRVNEAIYLMEASSLMSELKRYDAAAQHAKSAADAEKG